MKSKWSILIGLLVIISMLASACATATPEVVEKVVEKQVTVVVEKAGETVEKEVEKVVTQVVEKEVEKEVIVEKIVERTWPPIGAWPDTVVVVEEPSADAAVSRMEAGEIDIYAYQVSQAEVAAKVEASDKLDYYTSFGSYNELTFNPVEFTNGKLNPFTVPAVREAMNWLIDRNYIGQEIMGGMGVARWTAFNTASADFATMAPSIRAIEAKYAYDKEAAQAAIATEMEALGATLVNGKWNHNGAPVELIVLIRTEDDRKAIGDYVASQLEDIGFTVTRDYKTSAEASPIWLRGTPSDGGFHIYTGGWVTTQVPRSLADNFAFFYTNLGMGVPLWMAYENTPEFYAIADRLNNSDFTSLAERSAMLDEALWLAMEDSVRIWLVDRRSITPYVKGVSVAADLYAGVAGANLWAQTIRREGLMGGTITVAMPSMLPEPWNPIAGSNWVYDMMLIRGTGDAGLQPDPYTGLVLPQRVERAEVVIKEGLPVVSSLDWVTLEFAPEIVVPDDAWADWDAETGTFLTAAEVYTETQTVARKSTVYYPADMYTDVMWHDGSPLSIGDFVMGMILTFDRAKEASPYFDASAVPDFESFMSSFRGVKIVSTNPLVIETYSNFYQLDAELSVTDWWPYYAQGQGAWHTLALGLLCEADGQIAFSADKAAEKGVEWTGYVTGPAVEAMVKKLDQVGGASILPYAETLGKFVPQAERNLRAKNLDSFYDRFGHLWVGTGPLYLERAYPVEKTATLQRNPYYADESTKWDRFSEAALAVVDVEGATSVSIGTAAVYDVFVTFNDEPYASADLKSVQYLLFNATGELAAQGDAVMVEEGVYTVTLTAGVTGALTEGSNRLEIVVVSSLVALPTFESIEFVTTP
jgi:peptide/nickel transport system substrate-binding protein